MQKLKLSSKLWFAIILIVLLGSLFNYWTTLIIYEHFYVAQTEVQLKEKGEKIAEWYNGGEITQEFRDKVDNTNQISSEEIVLADNLETLGECIPVDKHDENPFTDEQINTLYNGSSVTITGEHINCKKDIIAVAVPLINSDNNDEFIGAIFVYMPLATVTEAVSEIKLMLVIYILIFLVIGIIVGKIVTNRITEPLREMEIVAKKMVDGDFNVKVDINSKDEIGNLGKTFNHLSESLIETIGLLSKEKKQLSQILDGINDGVITIDKDGQFIICNCSTNNIFRKIDIDKEQFVKIPIIQELIKSVIDRKEIITEDFEYKDRYYILYFAPLIEDENLWGITIVIHDVTEERQREKDAREFLAIVSHELRTPLSFMKGYTEALIDGVTSDTELQNKYLNTINKETERMDRLVNNLLDLVQLEKGTYKINLEKLRLDELTKQIIERYKQLYTEKNVSLIYYNITNNPLWVYADEDRMIQVLVNLLDNALRYTPNGGKVTVETEIIDKEIVLKVSDTGEGIEQKYLDKIGEKFFRANKARTRKNGGVGLGLAIVKQIIENINGKLEVKSTVGVGTTFVIYLPKIE